MIKQAVIESLNQGIELLTNLSQDEYTKTFSAVYNGSIGGHYRHQLEHFSMLLDYHTSGNVNYDHRGRDEGVETDRNKAIQFTKEVMRRVDELDDAILDSKLSIKGAICLSSDECINAQSSFRREAAFAISHANHHYAIIGIMCNLLELPTQEHFGVAPSTVKHHESLVSSH